MSDTPTPSTPATQAPEAPALAIPPSLLLAIWGWIKPALIHGSFHIIRAALIWLGSWTAMHHISFIASAVTPDRVNDIATQIVAYSVPLLAALDHAVRANPQIWGRLPDWCKSIWNVFHDVPVVPADKPATGITDDDITDADIQELRDAATKLPTVADIKPETTTTNPR